MDQEVIVNFLFDDDVIVNFFYNFGYIYNDILFIVLTDPIEKEKELEK